MRSLPMSSLPMSRIAILIVLLSAVASFAQEQKPATPPLSPTARLTAAKTAYIKNGGGPSDVPYDIISSGIDGWARFELVDSPEKADVVIEITTTQDLNGINAASNDDSGQINKKTNHTLDVDTIKLRVYDPRTHLPLWASEERPKGGFKDRTREDNLVKASETLLSRLHERLEPATPAAAATAPAPDDKAK